MVWLVGASAVIAAESRPTVVVSIKPLHSLVAAVMDGVARPELLIDGAGTPHGFALKPSQARLLSRADAVFWVGPDLEGFLTKPLRTLARDARIVTLSRAVALLPYRKEGMWAVADEAQDAAREREHGSEGARGKLDPHIWLDPVLTRTVVSTIVRALSDLDAAHTARYQANGEGLLRRLDELHRRIEAKLEPVRATPYLVFHDAYQYLERRYGLSAIGSVTPDPEYRPGGRHLAALRRRIAAGDVRCLFHEPQFRPSLLNALGSQKTMRVAALDPLGAAVEPGPAAYFKIMEAMADSLAGCLGAGDG